jgi:hypothetical protein
VNAAQILSAVGRLSQGGVSDPKPMQLHKIKAPHLNALGGVPFPPLSSNCSHGVNVLGVSVYRLSPRSLCR